MLLQPCTATLATPQQQQSLLYKGSLREQAPAPNQSWAQQAAPAVASDLPTCNQAGDYPDTWPRMLLLALLNVASSSTGTK